MSRMRTPAFGLQSSLFTLARLGLIIGGALLAFGPGSAQSQTVSLDSLAAQGATIGRDASTGQVSFIGTANADARLAPAAVPGDGPAPNARALLDQFGPLFGIATASRDMQVLRVRKGSVGSATRFQQTYGGIPVFSGNIVVN